MRAETLQLPESKPTILWLTEFGKSPSGLSIRHENFGRHLRQRGFQLHLVVPDWSFDATGLEDYRKGGIIDGFSSLRGFNASGTKGLLSRLAIHPILRNYLRRASQREFTVELLALIDQLRPAAILISERNHLFAAPALQKRTRVVMDWCDSFTLYSYREFKHALRDGDLKTAARLLYQLSSVMLDESYYPRFAHANLVICEPDRAVFKSLNKRATEFRIVHNGAGPFKSPMTPRANDRLIFSGVMNFPPNYRSALWFIDHVLPKIRQQRPTVRLVVAGRDPVDQLVARGNDFIRVTGNVPDLGAEIASAQVYVAPMISGNGFKNKIIEAFAAGTPVVGTSLAAEFLPEDLKHDVVVANNANDMANAIVRCLSDPRPLLVKSKHAQDVLRLRYSWDRCTDDLISSLALQHSAELSATAAI